MNKRNVCLNVVTIGNENLSVFLISNLNIQLFFGITFSAICVTRVNGFAWIRRFQVVLIPCSRSDSPTIQFLFRESYGPARIPQNDGYL